MQPFNWQSLKDNFHNPIFSIDKRYIRCIVDSTILAILFLPKGGEGIEKFIFEDKMVNKPIA